MGLAPTDPTRGFGYPGSLYSNVAGMSGKGWDVNLESHIFQGRKFSWTANLIFSNTISKVTKYDVPVGTAGSTYLEAAASDINPVVGKPLFGIYSYKWAGLDPQNGNPQGYLNGKISEDYGTMIADIPFDSMNYHGSATPLDYGAFRNTFTYKNFSLSVNISYKFKYYFRKQSVSYFNLFYDWTSTADYAQRWQNPGDEKKTNVPSLPTVNNEDPNRDAYYQYSAALVDKADNIRLEDISASYSFYRGGTIKIPFNELRLYFYASNLGLLWRANKDHLDPYYNNVPYTAKRFSFGLNITL
jgi:hypothetical protein